MSSMEERAPDEVDLRDAYIEKMWRDEEWVRETAMFVAEEVLDKIKADAWDEAVNEARARLMMMSTDEDELKAANPYR